MVPVFPERFPELWRTGQLHLDPNRISVIPKRIIIALAAFTFLTGQLLLVLLAALTWNALAEARNWLARSV